MSFERSRREFLKRTVVHSGALFAAASLLPAARTRAQSVGPVMDTLSRYMAGARERPLPRDVLEHAKHHVLDTVAAMVSGTELSPGHAALRFAATQTAGGAATVIGADFALDPAGAALVNGTLAHADETDDSHGPSQSHPGAAIVPAALALGERRGIDGARFLRAVTLGYDVGPRLTMALGGVTFRNESRRSTHAFAGTFGAAAAAGCVLELGEREMRWLLDYASQQTAGYAVWGRDTEHIEKAFVFGGMPARAGVTAAELVSAGWSGVDDVFSGDDNFFAVNAPNGDPALLVAALGTRYEIVNTDIKKWSVGSPIQAPLDALELLRRRRPFNAEEVTEVVVRLAPTVGAVVDNRDIPDICLQHMVAVMLLDGTASFAAAHDAERMQDAAVLRERAKVRYSPDAELAALLPARVAVVEVVLRDGTRLSERVEAVRGTVRNPMGRDEVVAKARDLVEPVLGGATASRLIASILALEDSADIRSLRPLLQRPLRSRDDAA
jgi:2-methylcitrate dehydratase PrpD